MSMLSTKQLRYLVNLAQFSHFGRAAEHSFVSQSAFSIAIKELEDKLGVQVVDRTNRQVTMTPIGLILVAQAKTVLLELDRMQEIAMAAKDPLAGPLRLGVIPTIAPYMLADFIAACQERYPQLQLYIREDLTANLHRSLLDGQLDLLLMALPMPMRAVEQRVLFRDPFYFAYHQDYPLINGLHPEDMADDSVMLLEEGHCLREHALAACELHNRNKISAFSATSLTTLMQMVASKLGVTYLPELSLAALRQSYPCVTIEPMGKDHYREVGLVWRKGSARVPAFDVLGQLITDQRSQ